MQEATTTTEGLQIFPGVGSLERAEVAEKAATKQEAVFFDGRVGERATPCGATLSPLVEPDKRISRHPALLKTCCRRLAQTVARLPASTNSPAQIAGFAHRN